MRKKITTSFLLFLPLVFFGQVKFTDASFEDVVRESKASNKLIFLQFESESCDQCNEVADKAFKDAALAKLLQESFVCFKVSPSHPNRQQISSLYNIKGFGSYFIDQQKALLHSYPKSTTRAADYKEQVDIVFNRAGEDVRLGELEKQYRNGDKTLGLLQLILEKRKSLNLQTDSLLDEYVSLVPVDSSESISTLVFIAQMAPIVDGKADKFMRKNNAAFNKAWYTMDLTTRISINNMIIYQSRLKAIREKDEAMAFRVASFARSTYNDRNSEPARQTYSFNLMNFYGETNDTAKYILSAVNYYDSFYMTVSVDSIMKRDSSLRREAAARAQTMLQKTGDSVRSLKVFSYAPATASYSNRLTEGALNLYFWTKDPALLQKALQWIERANSVYQSSESLTAWAKILYATGQKEKAVARQKQAIASREKQGYPTKNSEVVLAKMTKGEANIDN